METGRRRLRPHPTVADTLLAGTLAVVAVVYALQSYEERYRSEGWPEFDAWAIALTLLVNLPLAGRRRAPWTVFLVSCAALLLYTAAGYQPSVNLWTPLLACYAVITRADARRAVGAAVLLGAVWLYGGLAARLSVELSVAQSAIGPGIVWQFATGTRRLAERNAQLARMTERLRREQALRARHAVVEERVRIARELHDVIAHHLSALSVQAGLAEYVFASDPAAARAALSSVGATSREALEEMRGLLTVLRVDEEAEAPPGPESLYHSAPGLVGLDELAERTRAAGLAVEVAVGGRVRPLAPGVDLCAFRVVQEALTNALKHAGPSAAVAVALEYHPDRLTGRVSDDGGDGGGGGGKRLPGSGLGLIGMRERVTLYGGSLHAGPRPEGGFEVVFSIPAKPAGP